MRLLPLIAAAGLACAGLGEARLAMAGGAAIVPASSLKTVEEATNKRFQPDSIDPWEPLGDARGSYLPGYGAVFTFEMSLVSVTPVTPFHTEVSEKERESIHARKVKKLPVLKSAIRDLMVKAATTLTALPPGEQITFEAYLDSFSFEDHAGLPRRLTMTVTRQKILDALARHAPASDYAALIEEREE